MPQGDGNYAEEKIVIYFFEGLVAPILEFVSSLTVAMLLQSIHSIEEILNSLTGDTQSLVNPINTLLIILAVMTLLEIIRGIFFAITRTSEAIAYLLGIISSYVILGKILRSLGAGMSVYASLAIPITVGLVLRLGIWYGRQNYSPAWY
jgi:hypothetical protein